MESQIARDVATNRPVRIEWEDDRVTTIEAAAETGKALPYVAPGFFDIQINGLAGINFGAPDLSVEEFERAARLQFVGGVTHFLPTLITDSVERLSQALARLRVAAEQPGLARAVVGFHLEGPYISPQDGPRGAHPLEHCKRPSWDEFLHMQDAAGGRVKLVTLAPELEGAIPFIERLVDQGIVVAIGHTAAARQTILDAVSAGATLSTHLGNGAQDMIQRHHNCIFDQLAEDRLWASLIVDGHHLPPHVVDIFWRVKGTERTVVISDAVQYAGLPPGIYDGGYRQFQLREDGFIGVVGEPRLAGSGLMLRKGVENLVRFTRATLGDAVRAATLNPAKLMGCSDRFGALRPGSEASFVFFNWDDSKSSLDIVETVAAGRKVA